MYSVMFNIDFCDPANYVDTVTPYFTKQIIFILYIGMQSLLYVNS